MNQINPFIKKSLLMGAASFLLAICGGAFGAHALKTRLSDNLFTVFETAVDYHYYISISFLIIALLGKVFLIDIKKSFYFLISALVLFVGNLYLYVLTGNKLFAMAVPLGGVSFIISYVLLIKNIRAIDSVSSEPESQL